MNQTLTLRTRAGVLSAALAFATTAAWALQPADLAAAYGAQAGSPGDPARGERLFTTSHGKEWRCATCHGSPPTGQGRHAATGRAIAPLAPAFQAARLSDPAKVEKWFRRNCNDVLGRECTPGERADVMAWLISLKP